MSSKLNPYMYPPNSFHMPTIIDQPIRRRGLQDYALVAKLRSADPPRERVRAPPPRFQPVWEDTSKKRKSEEEEAENEAEDADPNSAQASRPRPRSISPTSDDGESSVSRGRAKVRRDRDSDDSSRDTSKGSSRPRNRSADATMRASNSSASNSRNNSQSRSSKRDDVVERKSQERPPYNHTSSTSQQPSQTKSSSSMLPQKRKSANSPDKDSTKVSSSSINGKEATATAVPAAPPKLAAPGVAHRLALDRLELTRNRTSGSNGNGARNTRLAAAASMVVEADLATEAAMFFNVQRGLFRGVSPSVFTGMAAAAAAANQSPTKMEVDVEATMSERDQTSLSPSQLFPSPSPLDAPNTPAVIPESFVSLPRLSESGLRRLQLSNTSLPHYISYEWVHKRCQKYLGLLTDTAQKQKDDLEAHSQNKHYRVESQQLGTLVNRRVYVAVSAQSDHLTPFHDEHEKTKWVERAGTVSGPNEPMPAVHAIKVDDNGNAHIPMGISVPLEQKEPSSAPPAAMPAPKDPGNNKENEPSNGNNIIPSSAASTISSSSGNHGRVIPMLGLFTAVDLDEGQWLTQYGGVLEWGGAGEVSVKNRARECNTHVRRIRGTDSVWNGRPWSLLFPRIPCVLEREMSKPLHTRTKLFPVVTNRTLINLLLLLHHEETAHTAAYSHAPHDRQKNHQQPFTPRDKQNPTICQGTCLICRNELNVVLAGLGGRARVGDVSYVDTLATFFPQCACCGVSVGLLPCEIHEIFSKWHQLEQEKLWNLCDRIDKEFIGGGGMGYMSNTDCKAKQNVRVFSKSPYISAVGDMYPHVHIYQTTRKIYAGEEILVAYNNNESKMW